VLSEDEKDLGVCLLDTAAGTTDMPCSRTARSAIRRDPIAGDQITKI